MVGVLLGLSATGCGDRGWSDQTIADSKNRGDQIVAALEAYRAEAGKYPTNLEVLVPRTLRQFLRGCFRTVARNASVA